MTLSEALGVIAAVSDILILVWLIATWFYEGHHKKCEVTVTCAHCGQETTSRCDADPRNQFPEGLER